MNIEQQLKAFRDVIAYSEGTDKPSVQFSRNRGYDVIVGGGLLTDYSRHPRVLVYLPRYKIKSSAAGRYQFIWPTWKALVKLLKLTDFTPASQDAACNELLRECGATKYLAAGKFDLACKAANRIWASLPGSPYGQRTETLAILRTVFSDRGGTIR